MYTPLMQTRQKCRFNVFRKKGWSLMNFDKIPTAPKNQKIKISAANQKTSLLKDSSESSRRKAAMWMPSLAEIIMPNNKKRNLLGNKRQNTYNTIITPEA